MQKQNNSLDQAELILNIVAASLRSSSFQSTWNRQQIEGQGKVLLADQISGFGVASMDFELAYNPLYFVNNKVLRVVQSERILK